MHVVVLTKGEWQAFGLVLELQRQLDWSQDTLTIWDDESPADWVDQMTAVCAPLNGLASLKTHPLNRDFAAHRNAFKATKPAGEWILMLDADEWIMPGFIFNVRCRMKDHPAIDSLFFERRNTFWDETGSAYPPEPEYKELWRPDFQGRGFRNVPEVFYNGSVHEGLHGVIWPVYLRGAPYTLIHHKQRKEPRYNAWKG